MLTLHLKRFEQQGFRLNKVSSHVDFSFVLDLAPFCSNAVPLMTYADGHRGLRYGFVYFILFYFYLCLCVFL